MVVGGRDVLARTLFVQSLVARKFWVSAEFASSTPTRMPLRVPAAIIRPGLSALPRTPFPPHELRNAVLKAPGVLKLTADDWGSLQAPSPATLAALAARLSFTPIAPSTSSSPAELLQQALTHPSCLSLYSKHYPNAPLPATNQSLAAVGNGLLGLFAAEWVHSSYPHLPNRAAKAAVSAYVGPRTLADVAKEWGALSVLRWSQIVRPYIQTILHPANF